MIGGIGPLLFLDIEFCTKFNSLVDERSNFPFIAFSNEVISISLEIAMKGELDLSSSKLCNFLKDSISKKRRGPMPSINLWIKRYL